MRAADFEFDTSVTAWSDYLQARLHPRSLASLRPHEHEYTDFELWGGRDRAGDGTWAWQRTDLMCRARGRPAAAVRPC